MNDSDIEWLKQSFNWALIIERECARMAREIADEVDRKILQGLLKELA